MGTFKTAKRRGVGVCLEQKAPSTPTTAGSRRFGGVDSRKEKGCETTPRDINIVRPFTANRKRDKTSVDEPRRRKRECDYKAKKSRGGGVNKYATEWGGKLARLNADGWRRQKGKIENPAGGGETVARKKTITQNSPSKKTVGLREKAQRESIKQEENTLKKREEGRVGENLTLKKAPGKRVKESA